MADGFDTGELDSYTADLLRAAQRDLPKEAKQFVRREGAKLRRATLNKAKASVHKNTGVYLKSIKAGKVYVYKGDGGTSIRVYSSAPHAHLIENGHVIKSKDGREVGFARGKYVFEESGKAFEPQFHADIDGFLDEVLGGLNG